MTNINLPNKDPRQEKHGILAEISEREKRLVILIHKRGPLHAEARDLYHKIRSRYERIIMCEDNEQSEVQDLEYCLWKLHYKHIDEFRKSTKTSSEQHNASHAKGFKLFLSEATEFYQNLVVKIRKYYRLPDESSFYRRCEIASFPEPKKIKQCHFLCHRFLVCLGDLARYREQYEKPDARDHNWSMAATYYLEATAIWPDSGNPQNQLAVLATYVGDEFLALYHCIRSLAVREPFPDARDNLTVLLERNKTSLSVPTGIRFNFMKPSERSMSKENSKKSKSSCSAAEGDVWSLFIITISFFFIKSSDSLNDFSSVFALTMRKLDNLMALDDGELKASLESYKEMDSVKTGPFRSLQAVSILLYTLQHLSTGPTILCQWAIPSVLIFTGRLVERCSQSISPSHCPLLPAILVFVEWLADNFEDTKDEKSQIAMSYFLSSFTNLLKHLSGDETADNKTPLWEDYELRGFAPVETTHGTLDFSSKWECVEGFDKGTEVRTRRIISAGKKLAIPVSEGVGEAEEEEEEEEILFSPVSKYKEPEEEEPPPIAAVTVSAGPPSLSAWVLDGGNNNNNNNLIEAGLTSIMEEETETSLYGLADTGSIAVPAAPSAPMLPDDAAWYYPVAEYCLPPVAVPVVQQQNRQLSSSEWLRQYLVERGGGAVWPYYYGGPVETAAYQRVSPYVCGGGGEMVSNMTQPQSLLQYLKERERQLHALNFDNNHNPTFLGN